MEIFYNPSNQSKQHPTVSELSDKELNSKWDNFPNQVSNRVGESQKRLGGVIKYPVTE